MCTFLVINTASVQLIPITAIALLASAGSSNPSAIIGTALIATTCALVSGLIAVKMFEKWPVFRVRADAAGADGQARAADATDAASEPATVEPPAPIRASGWIVLAAFTLCCVWFFATLAFPERFGLTVAPDQSAQRTIVRVINAISLLAIPMLLAFFPLYAGLRRVPVYEQFVDGAKEGFSVAIRIIPFLVAILAAIGMFRGAGGIDLLTRWLRPVLDLVRFPSELLPLALMRPLSGSGSLGLLGDLVKQFGPDSLIARMAATIYGSTETTFYVIAVYFGSVGVHRTRHAVAAGLIADLTGIVASIVVCRVVFGG